MFVKSVISFNHSTPLAGHLAARKTIARISAQFFWPSLSNDVVSFISNCRDCVQQKGPRFSMPVVPAGSITIHGDHFNDKIAWDIQGPLHLTTRQNKYILVISDAFSRFAVSIAIVDTTASTVAHMFIMHWVAYFGCPNSLMSDNGSQFTSDLMRDVTAILGVRLVFTPPYHPQSNGTVERLNQTFTAMVKKFVNESQTDWDLFLPTITYAYNSSVHETTRASPFSVVFGTLPPTLLDRFHATEGLVKDRTTWGETMRSNHDKLLSHLRELQDEKAQILLEKNQEADFFQPYSVGDYVWLKNNGPIGDGKKHKHEVNQLGPYKIVEFRSQQTYLLSDVATGKERVSHFSFLTPVDPTTIASITNHSRGGGEDIAKTSYSTDVQQAVTDGSQNKAKRRYKRTVLPAISDPVPKVSSTTPTILPTVVKSSHNNRKVVLLSELSGDSRSARRSTLSGRQSKMPARYLVTLSASQEGGGNDVTPE
jgi:transposase InsO family protein